MLLSPSLELHTIRFKAVSFSLPTRWITWNNTNLFESHQTLSSLKLTLLFGPIGHESPSKQSRRQSLILHLILSLMVIIGTVYSEAYSTACQPMSGPSATASMLSEITRAFIFSEKKLYCG